MQNTPKLNLPYPEPTDPPDGAAQIKALAEAIDNLGLMSPQLFTMHDNTDKPVGASWQNAYTDTWTVPGPGVLFAVGMVEFTDPGTVPGDLQARLGFDGTQWGAVATFGISANSPGATGTVAVIQSGTFTAGKGVQVIVQTQSTGSQSAGTVRAATVYGLFLPKAA